MELDDNEDEHENNENIENNDSFNEEDENEQRDIQYVRGDVTHPINTRGSDAIIVHCVGECAQSNPRIAATVIK